MAYKAPIWEDGKSPAISAENLNNLSQAAEGAQVLYGNSAPTSSTEGAVGQFYLVVVADSDGNYPLYQCVAIANGSYTWRDTRRIPDSITSMLGIPAPGTINRALNVLANVGNLHVWERVQTYADPVPEVPAGYTLGAVEENVILASRETSKSTKGTFYYYYGDSVTVSKDGTVNAPSNDSYCLIGRDISPETIKTGPIFVKGSPSYISSGSGQQVADLTEKATNVFYIPSGGTLIVTVDSGVCYVVATKYQLVTGYPYTPAIPAGTTTDYLTSTDPNAYPKQSAAGGQDAYYTLGDVVSNYDLGQSGSNVTITYSSDIAVDDRGMITLVDPGSIMTVNVESLDDVSILLGKFVKTSADSSGNIVFIPTDATASYNNVSGWTHIFMSKYQPVTGHAAIPANTTITYLGQLGGGARIEVGSYVGTGTYGSGNPNSLTFGFEPQLIAIFLENKTGNYARKMFMLRGITGASYLDADGNNNGVIVTWGANTISWRIYGGTSAANQMNSSGETYRYIAIG